MNRFAKFVGTFAIILGLCAMGCANSPEVTDVYQPQTPPVADDSMSVTLYGADGRPINTWEVDLSSPYSLLNTPSVCKFTSTKGQRICISGTCVLTSH
jgi:hypothetical protein